MLLVFALSRWPGLMPMNFSAAYALAFCAGLYFSPRMRMAPMGAMLLTDLLLNAYYDMAFQWYQLGNYLGYALLIGLGRWMHRIAHWSRFVKRGHSWSPLFLSDYQYPFVVVQSI